MMISAIEIQHSKNVFKSNESNSNTNHIDEPTRKMSMVAICVDIDKNGNNYAKHDPDNEINKNTLF